MTRRDPQQPPAALSAVAFHTGVADVLGYTYRLLRKAAAQGAQVTVVGPASQMRELDALLAKVK